MVKGNTKMDRVGWRDTHMGWRTPGSVKISVRATSGHLVTETLVQSQRHE